MKMKLKIFRKILLFSIFLLILPLSILYITGFIYGQQLESFNLMVVSLTSILIGFIAIWFFAKHISMPVYYLLKILEGNDLDNIKIKNKDELAILLNKIKEFNSSFNKSIDKDITELAHQIASTSLQLTSSTNQNTNAIEQISSSIQEVAGGAEQQASAVNNVTGFASRVSVSMQEIDESIGYVRTASQEALNNADNGKEVIKNAINQMKLIQEKVGISNDIVNDLGDKSKEIEQIVSLITEISEQTNLLALNAAIEAARAGEHGRGFSVVADEVRKLAEQSNKAAVKIQEIIKEIQEKSFDAVKAMEDGSRSVDEGITLNNQAGGSFNQIFSGIKEVTELIQDITFAVKDVNDGMHNVATSIEEINVITERSAGNTQSIAAAVEEQNASMQEISAATNLLSSIATELQNKLNR